MTRRKCEGEGEGEGFIDYPWDRDDADKHATIECSSLLRLAHYSSVRIGVRLRFSPEHYVTFILAFVFSATFLSTVATVGPHSLTMSLYLNRIDNSLGRACL